MFIAVEGPKGCGKSTLVPVLAETLRERLGDVDVTATREPTDSPLGAAIRAMEPDLSREALAWACLADRCDHCARLISPIRERGGWVITDRYVPSALVLQSLDGYTFEEIWPHHQQLPRPDLTIYLANEPAIIQHRRDLRAAGRRFDDASPARELALYDAAQRFLDAQGWRSARYCCADRAPHEIAAALAESITAA